MTSLRTIHILCAAAWLIANVAIGFGQPPVSKVRLTVVSADGSKKEVRDDIQARKLAGDYCVGDGLGYNLSLSLKEGGKYECTWNGCLGVYGKSTGTWAIDEAGLKLV